MVAVRRPAEVQAMTGQFTDPYPMAPTRPLLALSLMPWVASAVVITIGQILMWHGWNASGEWIPITGWSAVWSYALCAALAAAPLLLGLFILRSWISLAVVLVLLFAYSAIVAEGFSTTTSSTAAIGWIGPAFYGLPLVGLVCLVENVALALWRRLRRDR
jgi:hypothetical protein